MIPHKVGASDEGLSWKARQKFQSTKFFASYDVAGSGLNLHGLLNLAAAECSSISAAARLAAWQCWRRPAPPPRSGAYTFRWPVSGRLFGARVTRQPQTTNAAMTAAKITNCSSSAMFFSVRFSVPRSVLVSDHHPHAGGNRGHLRDMSTCAICNAGRACPHRTSKHPPDHYRSSGAGLPEAQS